MVIQFHCKLRRVSRFDDVGTTSGDVGTLLYRETDDAKQAQGLATQVMIDMQRNHSGKAICTELP